MMTVADVTRLSVATLVEAGFAHTDAHRDVAVLVRHLLEWDTAAWLTRQRDAAPTALARRLDLLVSVGADRGFGPVGIAAAHLGERTDIGDGIVDRLGVGRALRLLRLGRFFLLLALLLLLRGREG